MSKGLAACQRAFMRSAAITTGIGSNSVGEKTLPRGFKQGIPDENEQHHSSKLEWLDSPSGGHFVPAPGRPWLLSWAST